MSNHFQSALGYMAPEMACQSLRVTEKCDVYGFGVLILEIVTGRRPIEYGEDNVMILNEQVKVMLEKGNMFECVEESIREYPEEEVLPFLNWHWRVLLYQIRSSRFDEEGEGRDGSTKNFCFAPCGLVVLTVLPQSFKNSHFTP
ncbi:putative protein kinase RLK-Pelle-LRR-VII-1 family [Helianthus annuus]|nr:putative protein kinase RLK-Pelle-LRR-VII-1 family [Helianthus annuus]KAJ0454937.1 putative protein kinase RLK-Pelle-LRR-VII-1 family [Helianthus annuus]